MQLLKLVYIAHGWHLGYTGKPLINEEVQAWKYGPVIHSLYKQLRQYGSGAVREPVATGPFPWMRDADVDPEPASLLDSVWQNYAGYGGVQLSAMTHQQGTPWWVAWNENGGRSKYYAEIDDSLIEAHYKEKIAQARQQAAT